MKNKFGQARQKYLRRHAEAEIHELVGLPPEACWDHTLVIPAYRESPDLLQELAHTPTGGDTLLIILVVNRPHPGSAPTDNDPLLTVANSHPCSWQSTSGVLAILRLSDKIDLMLVDRSRLGAPLRKNQGVGHARKIGADLAAALIDSSRLPGPWIHCTDADTSLPADYFDRANTLDDISCAALVHPFEHRGINGTIPQLPTRIYETWIRHYPAELSAAGSPYAYHTLGSCLSVNVAYYCAVRGFPKRSAAEDFYILNKLAKVGDVALTQGKPLHITERLSDRVPFGTGPAVRKLASLEDPAAEPLFYHPDSYRALSLWLQSWPDIYALNKVPNHDELIDCLRDNTCAAEDELGLLSAQAAAVLEQLRTAPAIAHAFRQSSDYKGFERHLHTWFDGFRTLKFIRQIKRPRVSYRDL